MKKAKISSANLEEESNRSIKLIAQAMSVIVFLLGFFILYENPIRSNEQESRVAIAQVKEFAQFIEKRPELTAPRDPFKRFKTETSGAGTVSEKEFSQSDFDHHLGRWLNPESMDELKKMTQEHPKEIFYYYQEQFNQPEIKHDENWEKNVEGLMVLAETGHEGALDLVSEQLILARTDQDYHVQRVTDQWFQRYLGAEKRVERVRQLVDAYGRRIEEQVRQTIIVPENDDD
jgi:hypothetical protein